MSSMFGAGQNILRGGGYGKDRSQREAGDSEDHSSFNGVNLLVLIVKSQAAIQSSPWTELRV